MTALPILRDIVFGMQDSYSVLDLSRTETESGLRWGLRSGFDPKCRYGDGCPGRQAGIVSPKCLNGDDAQAGNRCSVRGLSGRSGCLKDRQDDFEVLEGSPTWVRCLSGLGMRRTGSHSVVGGWD